MSIDDVLRAELSKESVFTNKDLLLPSHVPDHMPFREEQIEKVTRTLAPALKKKKPNNLFLYGKTGTGKSSVTKRVLSKILEYAEKEKTPVYGVYMNCKSANNTKYQILAKIAEDLNPDERLQGFAVSYLYNKVKKKLSEENAQAIIILDEVDRIKDVDDAIYALTRMNDELELGGLSVIGISNLISFKEALDARTKSTLCEEEHVFPPYQANQLQEILTERVTVGFKDGTVTDGAISLAAAIAAQETGDARKALLLIMRAGDLADETGKDRVTEDEINKAKTKVEEDLMFDMVQNLPKHQQLLLYTIATLTLKDGGYEKLTGEREKGILFSGEVYDKYCVISRELGKKPSTDRWYREQVRELDMYGLISAKASGKGIRGNTQLISLKCDAEKMKTALEKGLGVRHE